MSWILVAVILPALSWVTAKLDTYRDVAEMRGKISELEGRITVLQSQRSDLVDKLAALEAPPGEGKPGGPIFRLNVEVRHAQRNAVRAEAIALAYERNKAQKKAAAEERTLRAFDNSIKDDGKTPSEAAGVALTQIALP